MLAAFGIMWHDFSAGENCSCCLTLLPLPMTIVLLGLFATGCNHLPLAMAATWNHYCLCLRQTDGRIGVFIFGAWTLRGDTVDDDEVKTVSRGILWTIALTFFLAELGQTMLATITLATTIASFGLGGLHIRDGLSDALALIIGAVLGRICRKSSKILRHLLRLWCFPGGRHCGWEPRVLVRIICTTMAKWAANQKW